MGRISIERVRPFRNLCAVVSGGGREDARVDGRGAQVRWRADGQELFYLSFDNRLMAVPVELGTDGQSVRIGAPAALFQANPFGGAVAPVDSTQYVVSADGQQFLFNSVAETAPSAITIVANWKAP
jgi:hypothetical protein